MFAICNGFVPYMCITVPVRHGCLCLAWKRLYLRECKTPCSSHARYLDHDATFFRRHAYRLFFVSLQRGVWLSCCVRRGMESLFSPPSLSLSSTRLCFRIAENNPAEYIYYKTETLTSRKATLVSLSCHACCWMEGNRIVLPRRSVTQNKPLWLDLPQSWDRSTPTQD